MSFPSSVVRSTVVARFGDTEILINYDRLSCKPAIGRAFRCFLMPVPSPDKWGGLRQKGHPAQNFFARLYKCVMLINPYGIGRGLGYQRPPWVSHGSAPVQIMLLLGLVKTREKREEEGE